MTTIGRVLTGLSSALASALDFNSATLSGAIDIIVVSDEHGRRHCSPFHVRFGKLQLLKSRGCPVTVELNGRRTDLRLYLGPAGEAYFYNPPKPGDGRGKCTDAVGSVSPIETAATGDPSSSNDPPPTPVSERASFEVAAPAPPMTPRGAAKLEESALTRPHSLPPDVVSSLPHPSRQPKANSDLMRTASAPMPIASDEHPPNVFLTGARDAQALPLISVGMDDTASGYVSDSEVEVSKNERNGTAEVVDEPRSPPVSSVERRMVKVYARSRSLRQAKTSSGVLSTPDAAPRAEEASLTDVNTASPQPALSSSEPDGSAPSIAPHSSEVANAPSATSQLSNVTGDGLTSANRGNNGEEDVQKEILAESSVSPMSSSSVTNDTSPVLGSRELEAAAVSSPTSDMVLRLPERQLESVTLSPEAENEAIVAEEAKLEVRSLDGYDEDEDDGGAAPGGDEALADGGGVAAKTSSDVPRPEELSRAVTEAFNVEDTSRFESGVSHGRRPVLHTATLEESDLDQTTMLAMSLCGQLIVPEMTEDEMGRVFEQNRLTHSDFASNPNVLFDPNLLFCIDDRLVEFRIAAPFVMSSLAFGTPLDVDMLTTQMQQPPGVDGKPGTDISGGDSNNTSVQESTRSGGGGFGTWFSWSRAPASTAPVGVPLLSEEDIEALDGAPTNSEDVSVADQRTASVDQPNAVDEMCMWDSPAREDGAPGEARDGVESASSKDQVSQDAEKSIQEGLSSEANASLPVLAAIGKSQSEQPGLVPTLLTTDEEKESVDQGAPEEVDPIFDSSNKFLSNVPTPEQLAELDLQPGANTIRFIVESSLAEVNCRIFLWGSDVKIVISDVDGTITKSDVLGHVLPVVGRDWSHVGVAGLYAEIAKHGYMFMYLTARPIGQASQTRGFLNSVIQGGARLPNGPVLMSPNRLVESFTREVIRRKPQEFKIQALREVRSLFSMDYNPFHAGFGNRETDVISYRAVGVIPHRIFVVNTSTELVVNSVRYESAASYNSLKELVNSVFPDIKGKVGREVIGSVTDGALYNNWNFWKAPLPDLDLDAYLAADE